VVALKRKGELFLQSEWNESVRADLGYVFSLGQPLGPIVWGNLLI